MTRNTQPPPTSYRSGAARLSSWLDRCRLDPAARRIRDGMSSHWIAMARRGLPLLVLVAIAFATLTPLLRPAWYDEAYFIEPAVSIARGQGIQSHISPDTIGVSPYGLNYPLYTFLLSALIGLFGLDFYLIRYAHFILVLCAIGLFLRSVREMGLGLSFRQKLLFLLYALLSTSVYQAMSHARPEGLVMLVFAGLLHALATARKAAGFLAIAAAAALVPWCGLHMVIPAAGGLVLFWWLHGMDARKFIASMAGLGLGILAVFLFYHLSGSWASYKMEATRVGGVSFIASALLKLRNAYYDGDVRWLISDWRMPRLLLLDYLAVWLLWKFRVSLKLNAATARLALFSLAFTFTSIFAIALFTQMQHWYGWLFFLPACLVFALAAADLKRWRPMVLVLCNGLILIGSLYYAFSFVRHVRAGGGGLGQHRRLESCLRDRLDGHDHAVSSFDAYYVARSRTAEWYPTTALLALPAERSSRVSKLVFKPGPFRAENRGTEKQLYGELLRSNLDPARGVDLQRLVALVEDRWNCAFSEQPGEAPPRCGAETHRIFSRRPAPAH
jgi:hypothetical protein